jgi:hypothetical protein
VGELGRNRAEIMDILRHPEQSKPNIVGLRQSPPLGRGTEIFNRTTVLSPHLTPLGTATG